MPILCTAPALIWLQTLTSVPTEPVASHSFAARLGMILFIILVTVGFVLALRLVLRTLAGKPKDSSRAGSRAT